MRSLNYFWLVTALSGPFRAWLYLVRALLDTLAAVVPNTRAAVLVAMCNRGGLAQMGSQRSANSQPLTR